jgi:hypothetical protein
VTVSDVNLRSGPGTEYDIIAGLNQNQALTVTGRLDDTTWLQVNTEQGQEGWVAAGFVELNLPPDPIPTVVPPPTPPPPTPTPVIFVGKVCQIRSGSDTSTIFLRQAEFDALGLPLETRVTVTVRETGRTFDNVTLGLDRGLETCMVRLAKSYREALGVAEDTDITPPENRLDRSFEISQTSLPMNKETTNFQGRVCHIKSGQDKNTIFLRPPEFNDFGVQAGTTVSVMVLDTETTVENVILGLDSGLATCSVRLARSLREDLGVAGDVDQPLENRPDRQFSIRLP